MTFGYDADVVKLWTIASSNRLSDHGLSLALALLQQRSQSPSRLIILVAHSPGGLVCEQALIFSDKRGTLKRILANTIGIVFLGMPHGGSSLASWGDTVAKYVNVFRGTNRDILKTHQPGAEDLPSAAEDFQQEERR